MCGWIWVPGGARGCMAAILDDVISGPPSWMTSYPVGHLEKHISGHVTLNPRWPIRYDVIQDGGPDMTSSKKAAVYPRAPIGTQIPALYY